MKVIVQFHCSIPVFHSNLKIMQLEITRNLFQLPVSLSKKLHLMYGTVVGGLTETRLDEDGGDG